MKKTMRRVRVAPGKLATPPLASFAGPGRSHVHLTEADGVLEMKDDAFTRGRIRAGDYLEEPDADAPVAENMAMPPERIATASRRPAAPKTAPKEKTP